MNYTQKMFLKWTLIGFAFGAAFGFCIGKLQAAYLPLPKKKFELCLQAGRDTYPGQTLHTDKTCSTGMRWVFQK